MHLWANNSTDSRHAILIFKLETFEFNLEVVAYRFLTTCKLFWLPQCSNFLILVISENQLMIFCLSCSSGIRSKLRKVLFITREAVLSQNYKFWYHFPFRVLISTKYCDWGFCGSNTLSILIKRLVISILKNLFLKSLILNLCGHLY